VNRPDRTVVTVSFPPTGKTGEYAIDLDRVQVAPGGLVVVEGFRGVRLGRVVSEPHEPRLGGGRVRKVVRPARDADLAAQRRATAEEGELFRRSLAWLRDHGREYKLVTLVADGVAGLVTLCVAAEERLDVRDDAKALSRELRATVLIRQVGMRDFARVLGGVGRCGRELCCSSFLDDLPKTSIRQAKDQGLALSPDKTTGACSRTLCCLSYEHDTYLERRRWLPKQGKRAVAGELEGKVIAVDVLRQRFTLRTPDGRRHVLDAPEWERNADREVPEPLVSPRRAAEAARPVVAMPTRREAPAPPSKPAGAKPHRRGGASSRRRRRGRKGRGPKEEGSE